MTYIFEISRNEKLNIYKALKSYVADFNGGFDYDIFAEMWNNIADEKIVDVKAILNI